MEITPEKPIGPERQINYVVIDVQEAFKPDYEASGMRLSDGSLVAVEVELEDQDGKIERLKSAGLYKHGVAIGEIDLPSDRSYRVVRIRSTGPLQVKRIYWECYNTWDTS